MVPRRLWLVVGLLSVALVPLAAAAKQALDGRGTITGSGTSYRLALQNTGDQAIRCMQLWLPAGTRIGTVTPAAGWLVGIDSTRTRIGAQNQQGLAPGATANFDFTTEKPLGGARMSRSPQGSAQTGASLRISGNCTAGSDKIVLLSGPGSTPPPPPSTPKCRCKSLEIVEGNYTRQGRYDIGFNVDWKLTCAPQGGGGCRGKIEVVPPTRKSLNFEVVVPKGAERICKGSCARPKTGPAFVRVRVGDDKDGTFGFGDRKGQTFRFKLNLFCKHGATFVRVGTKAVEIAYDEEGKLDRKQSDMNANGKPDGDEKK